MLIRFVVSNFLSFKEETEFNMLTGSFKIHEDHIYTRHGVDVLKAGAIYGANGAGKSNLIKAIAFFKNIIERGLKELPPKHKASPEMLRKPTSFEIEFLTPNSSFSYQIVIDGGKILTESLTKTSLGKGDEEIFERSINFLGEQKLNLHPRYLESDQDKLRKQLLEDEFIVSDKPFLSVAANFKENKIKEINEAFEWITQKLLVIFPQTKPEYILRAFIFSKKFHQFSNQLMCGFDTGITKIDAESLTLDEYYGKDNTREAKATADKLSTTTGFLEIASDAIAVLIEDKPVIKKLYTVHKGNDGQEIKFELSEESEGTQRLFNFIPAFYLLLFQNAVVLFDEIDQSIHSYLLKTLLSKVMSESGTTGQIIFTTHESNLLDLNIFRQDEIWFANKNDQGATNFYSLSEYKPRYDLDIRKGYLNGRFGAIPNTDNLNSLNWTGYAEKKQGV